MVRAKQTSPPYVTDKLVTGLRERLGSDFTLLDFDCNHMVPYSEPERVAALARGLLEVP
jgi:lipase